MQGTAGMWAESKGYTVMPGYVDQTVSCLASAPPSFVCWVRTTAGRLFVECQDGDHCTGRPE